MCNTAEGRKVSSSLCREALIRYLVHFRYLVNLPYDGIENETIFVVLHLKGVNTTKVSIKSRYNIVLSLKG